MSGPDAEGKRAAACRPGLNKAAVKAGGGVPLEVRVICDERT